MTGEPRGIHRIIHAFASGAIEARLVRAGRPAEGTERLATVSTWCAAAALYLLLAGSTSPTEVATGAAVASLATLWARGTGRAAPRRFAGTRGHFGAWARAIRRLVPATLRTGAVLAQVAIRGGSPARAYAVAFVRGPEDDAQTRGRRATALLTASLAPDSYVLRAAPARAEVLLHALGPAPAETDPRWLG